jgi:eukaryotic-like serine/threonine-protein kinase
VPKSVEPSRDLLIGLLALQTGLIDQGHLVAAFHAWTRDKSRSIAEHLVALGHLDLAHGPLLEGLAAAHLARHGGDTEKSLAAISVSHSTRESLARIGDSEIGGSLAHVGSDSSEHDNDLERTATYAAGSATSDGQRFRVLRPHAKGGLGAVFVALDTELHREVALKQILDEYADDPASRQRFLLEAEITGGLEHPGIVPVYGLGCYSDGRPYYAMRFIRGESFKDTIERFHADPALKTDPGRAALELRKLLRRFLDVCNAIEYAHSRGVLHRDIKPGNVIVGNHGETLVVDWGTAKAIGRADHGSVPGERTLVPSSPGSFAETVPGSALGTPAYMSPEQAAGDLDRIGPRSDVYSLGATLYCLLTGKRPFTGDDPGLVLRQVQNDEFPLPRMLNPSIDRALEAVCKKAMARRPEERYNSPRKLADDVERWSADEPVSAWREPFSRRARRWTRRNRSAVSSLAASVLVALAGTAAVLVVQTQANDRLQQANTSLMVSNGLVNNANAELKSANQREKQRFDLAMDAIKFFHGEVSEDLLLKETLFAGLRTKLLRGAADFYGRLEGLLAGQTDRESRAALGKAYAELGELTAKIGDQAAALGVERKALDVRRALASEPEADVASKVDVVRSLIAVGDLRQAAGEPAAAMACFEEARELLKPLIRSSPDHPPYRAAEARCRWGIARVQYETGRPQESLASHEQARAIRQALAKSQPRDTHFQRDLAASYHDIGAIHRASGRAAESLASYERARAIRQKLADAHPTETPFQSELSQSYMQIGFLHQEAGHLGPALTSLDQARAILQRLADSNPAVTQFEGDLAHTYQVIGGMQGQIGDSPAGIASLERARTILQKLSTANPTVTVFQTRLAMNHSYLGQARQRSGRIEEAAAEFNRAVAIMDHVARLQPSGFNLYNLACFRSLLVGIAAKPGSGFTAAEVERLGAESVDTLRRAVEAGLVDIAFMRRDIDLDALRSRHDFQLLMMDLAMPVHPFAPSW